MMCEGKEPSALLPLHAQDPDRIADYRLIGRLGEGGMGVVYLARSPRGRMVAVKTVRAELAVIPDFRRRFADEIGVARKVGGEWTAAVLDADPDAALPWVATEYVAGPTLQQVVTEHGPLPEHSIRGLASGLCRALSDIHAAGLIHRDVKPSNVLVTIDGPKVIDFGIVRAVDATHNLTLTGAVIGSPGFMSPEQLRGEKLTEASDIFSLGAVLAFTATGRLPFAVHEGSLNALMYQVLHEPPDLTGVPEPLQKLLEDCLAKDPNDRPTVADLRERQETQYHSLGSWLPSQVLARLVQDAVRLLDQEDPHSRMVSAESVAPGEVPAVPPRQPTTPFTATLTQSGPPGTADQTPQGSGRPDPPARPETPRPRLVDERRAPGNRYAGYVYWLLSTFALASTLTALMQFVVAIELRELYDSSHFSSAEDYVENPTVLLLGLQVLSGVGLVVCWLLWFAQVRAGAERLAPGRLRYRPSMAVVGWFIPVANLFVPKQIANDIWHASSPPGRGSGMAPAGLLHAWWLLWLTTFLATCLPAFWVPWPEDSAREEIAVVRLSLHLLAVAAVIVTARFVRRLTAMQAARLAD